MIDVVIPNNNEAAFLATAEKLGYDSLIFLYQENSKIPPLTSKKVKIGIITTKGGRNNYLTFLKSGDQDQHILEHNPPNVLFGCETKAEKDYLHQRASGLNHVICALAHKNKVAITFSFHDLLQAYRSKRAALFGRIMQNIRLCRKYHTNMAFASFATQPQEMRSPHDLQSLFFLLGMHQSETKKAITCLEHV